MESITSAGGVRKKESLPMSPHSEYDGRDETLVDDATSHKIPTPQSIYTSAAAAAAESLASQLAAAGAPLTSASFPSAAAAALNPLNVLPSLPTAAGLPYPGLDTLSMASALQSATLGLYSTQESAGYPGSLASAPWSKYLNHITSRKRRSAPSDSDSDISTQPSRQKRSASQPNGGCNTAAEINSTSSSPPNSESAVSDQRDSGYWDRRRKNNEAAKRSRDARRQKEEEIAMRAAYLEQENVKLRAQIAVLKNESAKLHFLLFNRSTQSLPATSSAASLSTVVNS